VKKEQDKVPHRNVRDFAVQSYKFLSYGYAMRNRIFLYFTPPPLFSIYTGCFRRKQAPVRDLHAASTWINARMRACPRFVTVTRRETTSLQKNAILFSQTGLNVNHPRFLKRSVFS